MNHPQIYKGHDYTLDGYKVCSNVAISSHYNVYGK